MKKAEAWILLGGAGPAGPELTPVATGDSRGPAGPRRDGRCDGPGVLRTPRETGRRRTTGLFEGIGLFSAELVDY